MERPPPETTQVCAACALEFPLTADYFYLRRDSGKFRSDCKGCFRAAKNARYARDPEHAQAIARKSYHRPEGEAKKGSLTKRRNREADPKRYAAILARYLTTHADELKIRRKEQHEANREERNAKSKAWYYANRERAIATARRWIAENPERSRLLVEATRVKRRSVCSTLTLDQWNAIIERFGGLCAYCDAPATELEHVFPLGRGGDHSAENVVPACFSCNRSKAGKWLGDWLRELATAVPDLASQTVRPPA